jgi:acyl-CoA reductase-like NAD-dependent aldehyde dehydrogenase
MAEMTVTPVATHGFFVDGKWLAEGDSVDIRAPYDGALIAHVHRGQRAHAEAAIAAAVKAFGTTRR